MIQKKICMLGGFAVGKTSLVERYVRSIFSERYQTTIGVKIDKKVVQAEGRELKLILWDIHGEDRFQTVQTSYLRGASGIFLVVDSTRRSTLQVALDLKKRADEATGGAPTLLLLNKADLQEEWDLDRNQLATLSQEGLQSIETSAKTGEGVEQAFIQLAHQLLT